MKQVESFDEFAAASRVRSEAFEMPAHMREEMEAGLATRFEEYQDPRNPGRIFIALVDGRIVGAATASRPTQASTSSAARSCRRRVAAVSTRRSSARGGTSPWSEARRR